MLSQSVRADAGTSQKAKWHFDRETGEWVRDTPAAEAPVANISWSTATNGPGLAYVAPPVFSVTAAPAAVRVTKPKRRAREVLLHPDVALPLVAALIVLILFLAWAA